MFQHCNSNAGVGFYFCEEERRGKGFCFKTWKAAHADLKPNFNVSCHCCMPMHSHLYEKVEFKGSFEANFYLFPVSSIVKMHGSMNAQDFFSKIIFLAQLICSL